MMVNSYWKCGPLGNPACWNFRTISVRSGIWWQVQYQKAFLRLDLIPGMKQEDTKSVWVKDEKRGIRPDPVTIGIENGTNVELLSGLKEGDEVLFR